MPQLSRKRGAQSYLTPGYRKQRRRFARPAMRKRNYARKGTRMARLRRSPGYRKFNTTLAQKLKTENRLNRKIVNEGGCSILRMIMQNIRGNLLTDAGFNNAGYGYPLAWFGTVTEPLMENNGTAVPTQTFQGPLDWNHNGTVAFLPQYPGSEACFLLTAVGALSDKDQRFGVLPNYNGYTGNSGASVNYADNFQYNQICMSNTYPFNKDTIITQGTTWESGNTLKVFRSWVRIELENPNYQTGMKVHILVVKLRSIKMSNLNGCDDNLNLNECFSQDASKSLTGGRTSQESPELQYMSYLERCRGKLPSKIFRVIKHKVCVLGPKQISQYAASSASPAYPQLNYTTLSPKNGPSTKTVTMAFGPKTIRRTHCSNMSDNLFTFQEMRESWQNQSIVMMYTEPTDTMTILSNVNNETTAQTYLPVNYRIHKTHKWKVTNNFSN